MYHCFLLPLHAVVGVSRADLIEFHSNYLKYGLPNMAASHVLLRVRFGMHTATSQVAIGGLGHQQAVAWLVRWVSARCMPLSMPASHSVLQLPLSCLKERAPQRLGNQQTGIAINSSRGSADRLADWCGMTIQAVREHLRERPRCEPGLSLLAELRWELAAAVRSLD